MSQSLEHKSFCRTDLLLISGVVCACCPGVIVCWCAFHLCGCEWALAALSAVYLYNSSLFKPWYLTGQVEVYCLMSSMWLQSGMCAADRRLCPVSDWGLGLVTGPGLIGWLVPPQPAHTPSPSARREAGLQRWERPQKQGWKDRLGAWMARWIVSTQWGSTRTPTHTEELILLSVPWAVTSLPHWQPQPCPLCPAVPVDFQWDTLWCTSWSRLNASAWL